MKNVKNSVWLRKLPIFALALILALSPLLLAAPVHADVLTGESSSVVDVSFFAGDELLWNGPIYYLFSAEEAAFYAHSPSVWIVDDSGYVWVYFTDAGRFDTVSGVLYFVVPAGTFCFGFEQTESELVPSASMTLGQDEFIPRVNTLFFVANRDPLVLDGSVQSIDVRLTVVSSDSSGSGGILSVFTGVSGWFADCVSGMTSMFWTAESGMTVLGYLAVASLALAVILLIFYLIAGWFKFR